MTLIENHWKKVIEFWMETTTVCSSAVDGDGWIYSVLINVFPKIFERNLQKDSITLHALRT